MKEKNLFILVRLKSGQLKHMISNLDTKTDIAQCNIIGMILIFFSLSALRSLWILSAEAFTGGEPALFIFEKPASDLFC